MMKSYPYSAKAQTLLYLSARFGPNAAGRARRAFLRTICAAFFGMAGAAAVAALSASALAPVTGWWPACFPAVCAAGVVLWLAARAARIF